MEYDLNYLLESFPNAAHHLATGEGDARKRVGLAHLAIHHLQPERMPEELRDDLEWIQKQLTKRDPERTRVIRNGQWQEEGLVDANLRTMKNKTASRIADRIYTLYLKIIGMMVEAKPGCFPRLPS